jgi:diguanylate cyclase (GGDEF)-like protein
MFMDLDHFKRVNDAHGHAAGDDVLRAVALRLSATLRGSDTICRLGGDEFVMLLADVGSADEADVLAQKVLGEITRAHTFGGVSLELGASIGTALFPVDGEDPDTLMRHADSAMYRAKRDGRNCHRQYVQDAA